MENQSEMLVNEKSLIEKFLFYLALLFKYKFIIIGVTSLASILAIVFAIISIKLPPEKSPLPNIYRAYAIVLFQEGGDDGISSMLSAFGIETSSRGTSSSQIAMQILNSRPFLDNIIDKFDIIKKLNIQENLKTTSRNIIQYNSEYIFTRESGSLLIAYTHPDPEFAADLVNYEVNLLEKWFLEKGVSIRSNEMSLMEEKLKNLTFEISKIEEEIESFQKKHGVLDIIQIAETQSAILIDLRTSLSQIELEIQDYSKYSTIEDPALTILKSKKNNIVSQIKRIEGGYTSSDGLRMPSLEELPRLSLEFTHLQVDLSLKNQLYQTLSERYEVTKLVASESGVFSVLEYAEIPERKIGPSRGKICVMVTFGSFAGTIGFIIFFNIIQHMIFDFKKKKRIMEDT